MKKVRLKANIKIDSIQEVKDVHNVNLSADKEIIKYVFAQSLGVDKKDIEITEFEFKEVN